MQLINKHSLFDKYHICQWNAEQPPPSHATGRSIKKKVTSCRTTETNITLASKRKESEGMATIDSIRGFCRPSILSVLLLVLLAVVNCTIATPVPPQDVSRDDIISRSLISGLPVVAIYAGVKVSCLSHCYDKLRKIV